MDRINLRVLFYKVEGVPDWINESNIIYCCENLINHKKYVGETKQTLNHRWSSRGRLSHIYDYENNDDRILFRAFRKYGLDNFEVYILERNLIDDELRLEREVYWIENLHTYVHDPLGPGYNLNKGGKDASQMHLANALKYNGDKAGSCHTPEAYDTQRSNHGGVLACNTDEANLKSIMTRSDLGAGDCLYYCHTKEFYDKLRASNGGVLPWNSSESQLRALETKRINGNGNPMYGCITPDSIKRRVETHRINREIKLSTEEGRLAEKVAVESRLDSNRKNHGGVLAWNTPEANAKKGVNATITRKFNTLEYNINDLKSKDIELTIDNLRSCYLYRAWINLLEWIPKLAEDPRWTFEYSTIFKDYIK